MSEQQKTIHIDKFFQSRLRRHIEVIITTLLCIIVLSGGGYLIDSYIQTKPLFLIIGTISSFIFTQIILYKRLNSYTKTLIKK